MSDREVAGLFYAADHAAESQAAHEAQGMYEAEAANREQDRPLFAVGDRVLMPGSIYGEIIRIDPDSDTPYVVGDAFGEVVGAFPATELHRVTRDRTVPEPIYNIPLIGSDRHTTRRRMRVNIERNTKGYNYDTTFEIESDDPEANLALLMTMGLASADRVAREEIAAREYTDANGLPGSDDTPF